MTKEQAQQKIQLLIERYDSLTDQEKKMNEEMTKTKFIRPLFEVLGWDFEEDVLPEDRISRGRVDYSFEIAGKTKFFLEAKPLKAEIDDPQYAKQATNYAWLKSVNWVVLTDFEGMRVFYPANRGQVQTFIHLNYNNYLESFEKLWLLSKESFLNGLIDKEAAEYGAIPEQIKVGHQLAEDMNNWRLSLHEHFKTWNDKLSDSTLDEGVQRILDRFIFIRSCEDRGIENDSLRSHYRIWQDDGRKGNFLAYLKPFFAGYKETYNSGLFDDHPVMDWEISSECFDEIISGLYKSKNGQEYDFSVIDADVLGGVYEQYLGHLLSKSGDGDDSKKKRKSQGIYYTPTFIVDYIVENTLGKVLKEKTPQEIANLKILDPACGSGSFLIKAFDYLISYNTLKEDKKIDLKTKLGRLQRAFRKRDGAKELTTSDKLDILRNNIYGVDIDDQAVEIAQLNLLLKSLDRKQQLPHLNNIKCGNSLINDPKTAGDKALNYNEQFAEVMQNGGFDVIIGNPPYIRVQELPIKDKIFFSDHYVSAKGSYDIYILFIEKALKLLKENGKLGLIVPNKFLKSDYGKHFINFISNKYKMLELVDFGDLAVFSDATTYSCILIIENSIAIEKDNVVYRKIISLEEEIENSKQQLINQNQFIRGELDFNSSEIMQIREKMEKGSVKSLGDISDHIFQGITTSADKLYILKNQDAKFEKLLFKNILKGKEVSRFHISKNSYSVFFPYKIENGLANLLKEEEIKQFPSVFNYLKDHKKELSARENNKMNTEKWYAYIYPKNLSLFEQKKILTQVLAKKSNFAFDQEGKYYFVGGGNAGVYGIVLSKKFGNDDEHYYYVLALLNSKTLDYYLKSISTMFKGKYYSFAKRFIEKLPIKDPSQTELNEISQLSKNMVNKIQEFYVENSDTNRWNQLKTEIERIDNQINQMVYKLYDLTSKEIKIIEESVK